MKGPIDFCAMLEVKGLMLPKYSCKLLMNDGKRKNPKCFEGDQELLEQMNILELPAVQDESFSLYFIPEEKFQKILSEILSKYLVGRKIAEYAGAEYAGTVKGRMVG